MQNKWEEDIDKIMEANKSRKNINTLLYGSSTFRLWDDYQKYFPADTVNMGFGGAKLKDMIFFEPMVSSTLQQTRTFLYVGANDIMGGASMEIILARTSKLLGSLKGSSKVFCLSTFYHPAFKNAFSRIAMLNSYLSELSKWEENIEFIDVSTTLKGGDSLFRDDQIHLNKDGYQELGGLINRYFENEK